MQQPIRRLLRLPQSLLYSVSMLVIVASLNAGDDLQKATASHADHELRQGDLQNTSVCDG